MFKILENKDIVNEIGSSIEVSNIKQLLELQLNFAHKQFIVWGEQKCPHLMVNLSKRYCTKCWNELKGGIDEK